MSTEQKLSYYINKSSELLEQTSFFSRLIGMHMPGKNALYFSQSLNFLTPCFVGDEITIEGEVIDKSQSTQIITIKTTIHNQIRKCLVDGIAKVIVRENIVK